MLCPCPGAWVLTHTDNKKIIQIRVYRRLTFISFFLSSIHAVIIVQKSLLPMPLFLTFCSLPLTKTILAMITTSTTARIISDLMQPWWQQQSVNLINKMFNMYKHRPRGTFMCFLRFLGVYIANAMYSKKENLSWSWGYYYCDSIRQLIAFILSLDYEY